MSLRKVVQHPQKVRARQKLWIFFEINESALNRACIQVQTERFESRIHILRQRWHRTVANPAGPIPTKQHLTKLGNVTLFDLTIFFQARNRRILEVVR